MSLRVDLGQRTVGGVRHTYYDVQANDDLISVASRHNISVRDLVASNPQLTSSDLSPGMRLLLPSSEVSQRARDSVMLTPGMRTPGGGFGGIGGLSAETFLSMRGIRSESPGLGGGADDAPRPQQNQVQPTGVEPLGEVPGTSIPRGEARGTLSEADLRAIMPNAREADIQKYVGPLGHWMDHYEINNRERRAAFLAMVAVESGSLRYSEEIATGEAYEGRVGLGNTQPGDGPRYKGRGLIQLTGRANYRRIGQALGLPLEDQPELAELPENSARIAAYFFKMRDLNAYADRLDIRGVTKRVNGGYNGLDARTRFWERGLAHFA